MCSPADDSPSTVPYSPHHSLWSGSGSDSGSDSGSESPSGSD
ncbi:unnamed protein product, partial [Medioppia subpectinata]